LFASGSSNGEVFLWGEDLEFAHLAHKSEITSLSFDSHTEYFLSLEKKSTELNIWRPTIFNYQ
jgi:WD40 repeat protein